MKPACEHRALQTCGIDRNDFRYPESRRTPPASKEVDETARQALLARIRTVTQGAGAAGLGIGDRTELKEFHPQENDIESHGATHAILTRLPGDDALKGLFQSRQHLEPHGLGSYRLFSYPSDEFDSGLHALTAEAR